METRNQHRISEISTEYLKSAQNILFTPYRISHGIYDTIPI